MVLCLIHGLIKYIIFVLVINVYIPWLHLHDRIHQYLENGIFRLFVVLNAIKFP